MPRKTAKDLYKKGKRTKKVIEGFRDEILTELFDSEHIHEKVAAICFRNYIHKDTDIKRDIVQETFMHLSKKKPEFIIELYLDNPDRLIGLGVRMAIWKGVGKNPQYPGYPKHSLAQWILYFSNLNSPNQLSTNCGQADSEDEFIDLLQDNSLVEEIEREPTAAEIWDVVKQHLTDDELEIYEHLLTGKKGRGVYSRAMLQRIEAFHSRVREIFKQQNLEYKNYGEHND